MNDDIPRWWEQWDGRLAAELEAFERRGLDFSVDQGERERGRLVLRGRARVDDGEPTQIVVVYPDSFPHTRVAVYAPDLELDRHQNPYGRNLCVLPRASIYWRPSMLAADLVAEQVPELVRLIRAGGSALSEAEYPQGEPVSTYFPYAQIGGVILPSAALRMSNNIERGRFRIRFEAKPYWVRRAFLNGSTNGERFLRGQALLTEVMDEKGNPAAHADAALLERFPGDTWKGWWVRFSARPSSTNPNEIRQEAESLLGKTVLGSSRNPGGYELIGAVFQEEVRQGKYEDVWLFLVVERTGSKKKANLRTLLLKGLRYSKEDLSERIPELASLIDRHVGIVGLGTLGAPVAHELARSQVGGLRVADYDYVDPGTTVRWPGGIEVAGVHKPSLLADYLSQAHPYVHTEAFHLFVGDASLQATSNEGAQGESQVLAALLEGLDLVVEATAEDNVSRVIAHLGHPAGITQIYLWSIEGYGGVVARVTPGQTGCFLCLERALSPESGSIELPPIPSDPDRTRIQPRGCDDPTFTAASVDLLPLSIQAVRLSFSTLCRDVPGGYPDVNSDVFVLNLRNSDGSLATPKWFGHPLPIDKECALCRSFA